MVVDERLGQVFKDRYAVIRELGRGAHGTVYLGRHLKLDQQVAIKIADVDEDLEGGSPFSRLEREARAVALIGHENIVRVVDFDTTVDGCAFLVMEYLEGETLLERLTRSGRLSLGQTCDILIQVAYALQAAHGCGVIHRDVKPANVFLARVGGRTSVVKLLDFGIASLPRRQISDDRTPTYLIGTPGYVAPELLRQEPVDYRADVYSLGVTMYEMLVGALPFSGSSATEVVLNSLSQQVVPVGKKIPEIALGDQVDRIIERALRRRKDQRLESIGAFRRLLIGLRRRLGQPTRRRAEHWIEPAQSRSALSGWLSTTSDGAVLKMAGPIDEHAELEGYAESIIGQSLTLKLAGITRITSVGHQRWIHWLRGVVERGIRVSLEECSAALVRQANLDPGFFQGLTVRSFYAPYFCNRCHAERMVLLDSDEVVSMGLSVNRCECSGESTFDEVEDTYLLFLQGAAPAAERADIACSVPAWVGSVHWPEQKRRLRVTRIGLSGGFVLTLRDCPPVGCPVSVQLESGGAPVAAEVSSVHRDVVDPAKNGFYARFRAPEPEIRRALADTLARLNLALPRSERRRHVRVTLDQSVGLRCNGQRLHGRLLDMSMSGALLATAVEADLSCGDQLCLELSTGELPAAIVAASVLRADRRAGVNTYALCFAALDSETALTLEGMLIDRFSRA